MGFFDDLKQIVKDVSPDLKEYATKEVKSLIEKKTKSGSSTPVTAVSAVAPQNASMDYMKYLPFVAVGLVAILILKKR